MEKMYVNHLPCITWKWLKMNGVESSDLPVSASRITADVPSGWTVSDDTAAQGSDIAANSNAEIEKALFADKIVTGLGPDMDRLIKEADVPVLRLTASADEPLVIENIYKDGDSKLSAVEITIPDGVDAVVTEKFISEDVCSDGNAVCGFQTRLIIGKNASVKLDQVQKLAKNVVFYNDIGTFNAENGRFELVEVILAGGSTYFGSRSNLAGRESSLDIEMAYLVKGKEALDSNIAAFQRGKRTDAQIRVNGVLKDEAKKLTKATIDFKTGSTDSVGSETEDVLMMSDNVVNRTVPLILCTEESVEGVHGATLGRPSEEIMTYMMSRGLDKNQIYDIMEKARLDAAAAKIHDEQTRREIAEYLHPGEETE
ncbi:MAG: SufD family Fe-S cluster assembly protein [Oscillospiraceae bacterium]|nr:SufD family Fe-S cluster assembly protein [Oscillospiraceae bacterium]